jgi:hypothetical protein
MVRLSETKGRGSFGIPEELRVASEKQKTRAKVSSEVFEEAEESAQPEQTEEKKEESKKEESAKNPEESAQDILEGLGASFSEEDFQRLIFKGYYEAEVPIVKDRLKAKIRTLTSNEYDEVDEIIAGEIKDIDMTNDGMRARQSMWIISFSVVELNGKPLCKPIKAADGSLDLKAMATERRKAFKAMAPAVVNILIQKQAAITIAINMITANPGENLKNS